MFAPIAAIIMAVGTISSTVSVTSDDYKSEEQARTPVVEVQKVETSNFLSE